MCVVRGRPEVSLACRKYWRLYSSMHVELSLCGCVLHLQSYSSFPSIAITVCPQNHRCVWSLSV